MRLIDADKIRYKDMSGGSVPDGVWYTFLDDVEKIPTVKAIPIDKPFLKMRYGDYVVYNKKWLVNHLQTEWNILQGNEYKPAIPIEWIVNWLNKNNRHYCDVDLMLEDWEKENEKGSE